MKLRGSRIVAILLSFTMIATTFAFAAETEEIQTAKINYLDYFEQSSQQMECYYDDSFWSGKSTVYNKHLASLSMAMALTVGDTESANGVAALKAIGCENVTSKDYNKTSEKAAASVMGTKKLANGTKVIAIVIRGSRHQIEWKKSVEMGKSGDATGYSAAAKTVYNNAVSYIKKNAGKKYKIWITGHSRGGAITNLAGRKLSDKYGKAKVYAYNFEGPVVAATGKKNKTYTNIHNVRSTDSGVTFTMPSYMNAFGINGKWDKTVSALGGNVTGVKQQLSKITTNANKYQSADGFKWAYLDLMAAVGNISKIEKGDLKAEYLCGTLGQANQKEFWNVAMKRLKLLAGSRKAYAVTKSAKAKYAAQKFGYKSSDAYTPEKAMITLMKVIMDPNSFKGANNIDVETVTGNILSLLTTDSSVDLTEMIDISSFQIKITDKVMSDIMGTKDKYFKLVQKIWNATSFENTSLTSSEKKQLKLMLATLTEPLFKMIKADFDGDKKEQVLVTLLYNMDRLVQAHYPEVTMAWLMSQDSLYN